MFSWQGRQVFGCLEVVFGSLAGQRSPTRLVPECWGCCGGIRVWEGGNNLTSGPQLLLCSQRPERCDSARDWVEGLLPEKARLIQYEMSFSGSAAWYTRKNWGSFVGRKKKRKKASSKLTAFKQDIPSRRIAKTPPRWKVPVVAQPRAARGAAMLGRASGERVCARMTSLQCWVGVSLLFPCLFRGRLLFLCPAKYRGGREENCSGRRRLVTPRFLVRATGKTTAYTCRSRLAHQSSRAWWGWWV